LFHNFASKTISIEKEEWLEMDLLKLVDREHVPVPPGPWQLLCFLAPPVRDILAKITPEAWSQIEEIRLRQNRPLMLSLSRGDTFIDPRGRLIPAAAGAYLVTAEDMKRTLQLMSNCSLYSLEEELRQGFITLPGGHRVGLTGKALLEGGKVRTLKYITGLNLRIARELPGVADKVMPYVINQGERNLYHTLIVSPPQGGKTTLLRDMIRQISWGIPYLGLPGRRVGLVDERSEIGGSYAGVPQKDLGPRTDILDGCPKAEGMMMLIRAMSPQVIATDELGREEDVVALEEALQAGVKLLTTVHGHSLDSLKQRPILAGILRRRIFERIVFLGFSLGVGTLEGVIDGRTYSVLLAEPIR
jgi:stage III sporulation protein AA